MLYKYREDDADHGRLEHREYYLSYNTECMKDMPFESVRAIGYVIWIRKMAIRDEQGEIKSYETRRDEIAYIMDQCMDVKTFAEYVRNHWRIENPLHWVLDDSFQEDRSTIRKGNAMENTSLLRKVSYDIIRICKTQIDKPFEYIRDEVRESISFLKAYVIDGIESLYRQTNDSKKMREKT